MTTNFYNVLSQHILVQYLTQHWYLLKCLTNNAFRVNVLCKHNIVILLLNVYSYDKGAHKIQNLVQPYTVYVDEWK